MWSLYKKFKGMTGKRGADLAESNNVTRQYVSLLATRPSKKTNWRLALMMQAELVKVISEKEKELSDLVDLYAEITDEIRLERDTA